jgi:phospholipid/cholesterol/gamma-HCH transport system permease protein
MNALFVPFIDFYEAAVDILNEIGGCIGFIAEAFRTAAKRGIPVHETFVQIWRVSMQSLTTTALAGFFVGALMTLQFSLLVRNFGALGFLGGLSTSATIREVGPLLIAFMLSGKVGAYTSAELGTMRVTEQIDAIRCLGASPFQEIILPRIVGIIISSFFLLLIGLLMSIAGGLLMGIVFAHINSDEYLRNVPTIVNAYSIANGLFKCLVFAILLATICTYKGYTTTGGSKGVGRSVVSTAVSTMVGIVIADWVTSVISEAALNLWVGR